MAQVASLNTEAFFEHLWQDYIQMAPAAAQLQQVFLERGEQVVNDHVALRTFNLEPIQLTALEPRYPDADGTVYQGFVAASADRIFESTHVHRSS